jgi:hypothetical protein
LNLSVGISLFAALVSVLAIFITVIFRKKDARPWLVVEQFAVEKEPDDRLRVIAQTKNLAGGPALDVQYQFCIEGQCSGYNNDSSAIFPGATVFMHMPTVGGWEPEANDKLTFEVRYKDIYGNSYSLQQVSKAPSFLLEYRSEPKREWRNLWLKI